MAKHNFIRAVSLLLLSGVTASASISWQRIQSEKITVLADSAASAQSLYEVIQKSRNALTKLGVVAPAGMQKPITVIATSNRGLLSGAWPVVNRRTIQVRAITYAGEDLTYIVLDLGKKDADTHFLHEFVHAVIHEKYVELPAWIDEGLAEHYSTIHVQNSSFFMGPLDARNRWQQGSCTLEFSLMELAKIDLNSREFSARGGGKFYHSAALVLRYLVERHGIQRVFDLLDVLAIGKPTQEAMSETFKQSPAQIEAEAVRYCKASPSTHSYATDAGLYTPPKSSTISGTDFEIAYADMQARSIGHQLDATRLYEARLQRKSDDAEALRGIGIAHIYQKDYVAAFGFLKAAYEGLKDDPATLLFFSLACMNTPDCDSDEYSKKLEHLATLRPDLNRVQDWVKVIRASSLPSRLESSDLEDSEEDSPFLAEESGDWHCGQACDDDEKTTTPKARMSEALPALTPNNQKLAPKKK